MGALTARPYPPLRVTDAEIWQPGHALLLSGQGKNGVQDRAQALDGALVTVSGIPLTRGEIDMPQLRGDEPGLSAADGIGIWPDRTPLGRWRITGEVCDGKCYAGAMRPGEGLAHKACANLCIVGGVPPIFVAPDRVEATEFPLPAGPDGGPVTDEIPARTAEPITAEGELERLGQMTAGTDDGWDR